MALSPYRPAAGVRRGVRHNARRLDDGRWTWRYDLFGPPTDAAPGAGAPAWVDFTSLWEDVSAIRVPCLFVRGGLSPYVRERGRRGMQRRLPRLEVVVVENAGHAVQSDQPLVLADLIRTSPHDTRR